MLYYVVYYIILFSILYFIGCRTGDARDGPPEGRAADRRGQAPQEGEGLEYSIVSYIIV